MTERPPRDPSGWYQIAASDELPPGSSRPTCAFGRNLVLFRTAAGAVAMLDETCPHAGFPMAGGRVVRECLECPHHAWLWSTSGSFRGAPAASPAAHRLRAGSWSAREVGGAVLMWFDSERRRPAWSPPSLPDLRSHASERDEVVVRDRWTQRRGSAGGIGVTVSHVVSDGLLLTRVVGVTPLDGGRVTVFSAVSAQCSGASGRHVDRVGLATAALRLVTTWRPEGDDLAD